MEMKLDLAKKQSDIKFFVKMIEIGGLKNPKNQSQY